MAINTQEKTGFSLSAEIERDMRTYPKVRFQDKPNGRNFLEQIARTNPLLGMQVISENHFKAVEKLALKAIKHSLEYSVLQDIGHLAIFMTVIRYAKNWERSESSGFWAYICEQLGYKYSETLYGILTGSIKRACDHYQRLFITDSSGANSYYSTVLAHAIAPRKSFFALCDFLVKFYKNNLDCAVYSGDPAIVRMVEVLRDRCQGATIEQDKEIRGNVSGIQTGFKSLLAQRPVYMRSFLTSVLRSMDLLLSGDELGDKNYTDVLLTQWYIEKLTEPLVKPGAPRHKRTTEIAFSYGKICISFILDEQNEPAIRIPSVRLESRENPVVIIYDGDIDIYRQSISIYGNDYAATSEETIIPLSELSDIHSNDIRIELIVGDRKVFVSDKNFRAGTLLFRDGKCISSKTVEEGNYVLFAFKQSTVKFDGEIERQRRPYFAWLYDFYMQGESSVYVDGILLCCSRLPGSSLRFRLPQSNADYVADGISYPIYARADLSVAAVGLCQNADPVAKTDDGVSLSITSEDDGVFQIELPINNGRHTVTLTDSKTGNVLDEINFCIVDHFDVRFDKPYYLENSEEGTLTISVDDESRNILLPDHGTKVQIPYEKGELFVQVPRIHLLLDGRPLPENFVWKGDIAPASGLRVICPGTVYASLTLDRMPIGRTEIPNGFEYAIGNAIQAYDGDAEKLSVDLSVAGDTHHMFQVICKPCLTAEPQFSLNGNTLMWLNSHSFVGRKETKLQFTFQTKNGEVKQSVVARCERMLFSDFPKQPERYHVTVSAVTETAFGKNRTPLYDGSVIFGNKYEVIFRGEVLRITRVIEEGMYLDIKPVFIDNIRFMGKENLGFTDLSGEYAHYTGNLYFNTRNGIRYFTDINPVDIYLVNDTAGRLHISFDNGAGLFVDKSGEYGMELYKHTDPPQRLAQYFFIPDFFEYKMNREM